MSKSICLCMIVKNEEKTLPRSLNAVLGIIDYYVIVDTGSTDKTKEVARKFLSGIKGEIIDRPWVNFGHNRTESLALCKNKADYILLCDADEEMLIDADFNKDELKENAYNLMYVGPNQYWVPYLVRGNLDWCYKGVTHEWMELAGTGYFPKENLCSIKINHHHDGGSRDDKFSRDIRLLLDGLKEEPDNARYMFYLANSYRDTNQYEDAVKWYLARIKAGGWQDEVYMSHLRIAQISQQQGMLDRAIEHGLNAYETIQERSEGLILAGCCYRQKKMHQMAFIVHQIANEIKLPVDGLFVDVADHKWNAAIEYAVSCYHADKKDIGKKVLEKMLPDNNLPQNIQNLIVENLKWYQ